MTTTHIKTDVYQIVTDRIITAIENGTIPWKRPWKWQGLPQNLISRKAYRGVNLLLLGSLGYSSPYFLTFHQAKQLGGTIKKGEHACLVVFWKELYNAKSTDEAEEYDVEYSPSSPTPSNGSAKRKRVLRYYNVFNVEQCEGLPSEDLSTPVIERHPIRACEDIVEGMPFKPPIVHQAMLAFYQPALDVVNMPPMKTFDSSEEYYSTLFHELVHSTGHHSRLDRKELPGAYLTSLDPYSVEELIAEIGASFLGNIAGIEEKVFDNSTAYIGGWLRKLQGDKKFIIHASSQAQRAVDYILNASDNETEKEARVMAASY